MKTLGPDYFGNIVAVDFGRFGPWPNDALLAQVGALRRLEYLALGYRGVLTGQGLKRLQGLTRLKTLSSFHTQFSGSDLAGFAKMVELEHLPIREIQCSDDDLAHLTELTRLKSLYLAGEPHHERGARPPRRDDRHGGPDPARHQRHEPGTDPRHDAFEIPQRRRLTDRRRRPGTGRPHSRVLSCSNSVTPGSPITAWPRYPGCRSLGLDLDRTQIGDSGLNLLCDFPAITQLRLTHTDVTDSGLAAVADKLNAGTCWILGISGVRLTGAGMKSLSERLTHTQLIGDGRVYHIGPRATVNRKPTAVDEEMPQ